MAIAYFIPDQAKLLSRNSGGSSNNNNNSSSATHGSSQPATTSTTTTTPTATATSANYNNYNINSNNYRANITIPLNPFAPSHTHHHVGCWDLITQVFCFALRFYNESSNTGSSGSALIKITVEISGGNGSPPSNTTTQQQPTSESTPSRKN